MSIAMACDFSIAEETAKMVFAFVNIGFVPDGGAAYMLSKAVGPNQATELLMSGKRFSGAPGERMGDYYRSCAEGTTGGNRSKVYQQILQGPRCCIRADQKAADECELSGTERLHAK